VIGGNGTYHILLAHPRLGQTSGAVSLKMQAWDTAGNQVEQVIDRAYGLRAPVSS